MPEKQNSKRASFEQEIFCEVALLGIHFESGNCSFLDESRKKIDLKFKATEKEKLIEEKFILKANNLNEIKEKAEFNSNENTEYSQIWSQNLEKSHSLRENH